MAFSIVENLQATNTASPAVTTSAGVTTTDVILFVHSVSTTSAVPTKPGAVNEFAGLTATTAGTVCQTRLYWVVAAPSTTYTFGRDTAGRNTLTATVFRGLDTVTPFGAKDQVARATAESHTTPTVATSGGGDLLIGVWSARVFPTNNWTLDTSGYTEHIDAVGADGSTNCRVMVASNPTAAASAGSYSATAHLNAADGEPALVALLEANPAATGQSAAAGTAAETDAAVAVGRQKAKAAAATAETDTAFAVARVKRRTLGVATEADAATALARAKTKAIGTATETDTALPIAAGGVHLVGRADEADSATSLARTKTRAVATAAAPEAALPLARRKARTLGTALEVDAAVALAGVPVRDLQLVVGAPEPAWTARPPDGGWTAGRPAAAWTTSPPEA